MQSCCGAQPRADPSPSNTFHMGRIKHMFNHLDAAEALFESAIRDHVRT